MSKVLVIDDEPKIVSFVTRALTARGYDVDSAENGAEGLELIRMGGYAWSSSICGCPTSTDRCPSRTLEERPDQQVIVLSALPDVDTKVRCLDIGAADYITKPFSLTELLARVRRRVRQRASDGERFLRAGRLVLDLRNRAADVGGGTVTLAAREFLLLQHLVRHRDEVCTRESCSATSGATHRPRDQTLLRCASAGSARSSAKTSSRRFAMSGTAPRSVSTGRARLGRVRNAELCSDAVRRRVGDVRFTSSGSA